MAGDYIPMRLDLAEDPAVISIAATTKLSTDLVVGKLHRFWSWANRHTSDGRLPGVPADWLDTFVGKKGFAAAMAATPERPWLVIENVGITIPNFDHWNGQSAKKRLEGAIRKRRSRENGDATSPQSDDPPDNRPQMSHKKCDHNRTGAPPTGQDRKVHSSSNPTQGKASNGGTDAAAAAAEDLLKSATPDVRVYFAAIRKRITPDGKRMLRRELEWALKVAMLADEKFGEAWLRVGFEAMKNTRPEKPQAFLQSVLDSELQTHHGTKLNREMSRIIIAEPALAGSK